MFLKYSPFFQCQNIFCREESWIFLFRPAEACFAGKGLSPTPSYWFIADKTIKMCPKISQIRSLSSHYTAFEREYFEYKKNEV